VKASVRRVARLSAYVIPGLLLLSACASSVVSRVQPSTAQLSCSSGEGPIAERYYQGTFNWVCGPLPCPPDQEAVWKPIDGSEATAGLWGLRSRAGLQKVSFTCANHCDSGDPRKPNGECPGLYFLHSRVEQNTLILTAVAMPLGTRASSSNFKPTSSRETYLRIPGVVISINDARVQHPSGTTDKNGEARFDLASEPFRHVVKSSNPNFVSAKGRFRDGTEETLVDVSTSDSQLSKETRESELAQLKKNQTEERARLDDECERDIGDSCMRLAHSYGFSAAASSGTARQKNVDTSIQYYRKACALKVDAACTMVDAIDQPPSTANICAEASGCTERCPAHACIEGCVQQQLSCQASRPTENCAAIGAQCVERCGGGACLQRCFRLASTCTRNGGRY
jgi:hypothetical protein